MSHQGDTVGPGAVRRLWRAGAITRSQYLPALALAVDGDAWRRWGQRVLLGFAVAHLLAAVIFFFAFNWQDLPRLGKLGIVGGGVAVAALASLWPLPRLAQEMALLAALVLTGVLLAVFGQVYQTGADAWQLFATWAALCLPWVAVSRNAAVWLCWLVVAQIAVALFVGDQPLTLPWRKVAPLAAPALPALLTLAVVEAAGRRPFWLATPWARVLLLADAFLLLFLAALPEVIDAFRHGATGTVFFFAVAAVSGWAFAVRSRDLTAMAVVVLASCTLVSAFLVRLGVEAGEGLAVILSGVFVLLTFAAGTVLLRRLHAGGSEA